MGDRQAIQGHRRPGPSAGAATAHVATGITVSWVVIVAVTLAQAAEAFTVQGFPALVPFMVEELALTKARTGMLTSAFFAGGFVPALPAGWVIDRIGVANRWSWLLG